MATIPTQQLAAMLQLNVAIEPVLIQDITSSGGQAWAVRLRVGHPSGVEHSWTMSAHNARAIATELKKIAGECDVKVIPAGKSILHT